jgi:hypothetical protein
MKAKKMPSWSESTGCGSMKAKKVPSRRTSSGRVMPPRRLKAVSLMAQAIGETGFAIGSEGDCYCEHRITHRFAL